MDTQTSNSPFSSTGFSGKSKQKLAEKTIADLLVDKTAMDDWTNNIEKIRQKESCDATRKTA